MKLHHDHHENTHGHYHWVAVAIALGALLLTLGEAHGQSTGSQAMFEGRPAIAGAQGGLGAQAGLPQGGLAVESNDVTRRDLREFRDRQRVLGNNAADFPQGKRDDTVALVASDIMKPDDKDAVRKADPGMAKSERSAVRKSKRAARNVAKQARTGVGEITSSN